MKRFGLVVLMFGIVSCAFFALSSAKEPQRYHSLFGHLGDLHSEFRLVEEEIQKLAAEKRKLDSRFKKSREAVARLETNLKKRHTTFIKRLKTAYKTQSSSSLEYLLASKDFNDYILRRQYLSRLWQADNELIQLYARDVKIVRAEKESLQSQRTEYDRLMGELAQKEAALAKKLKKKKRFLRQIQQDASLKRRIEEEKRAASKDLQRHMAGLVKMAAGTGGLSSEAMICPVDGRIEVNYGETISGDAVRFHSGWDLRAKEGTAVVSPAHARVAFAKYFRGFGNLVILDHGKKIHTLYAHMLDLEVKEGDSVKPGDRLGTVGDTDSLKGSYLYFELRRKGNPLNPRGWFQCIEEIESAGIR